MTTTIATVHLPREVAECPRCHGPEGIDLRADDDGKVRAGCVTCKHTATLGTVLPKGSALAKAVIAASAA